MSRSMLTSATRKVFVTVLVLLGAAPAFADVPGRPPGTRVGPPPDDRPISTQANNARQPESAPPPATKDTATEAKPAPFSVTFDPQTDVSTLIIPRKLASAANLSMEETPSTSGGFRQAMAAIALSGAVTGLFFVRRNRKARLLFAGIICLGAIGGAASVLANAPPPHRDPPDVPNRKPPVPPPSATAIVRANLPRVLDGKVEIKYTDIGDTVHLILGLKEPADSPTAEPPSKKVLDPKFGQ